MPPIAVLSGKETRRILEANGFVCVRQRGSHMIMQQDTEVGKITVPVPDHKELRSGTLSGIIRQSGLDRSLFEK